MIKAKNLSCLEAINSRGTNPNCWIGGTESLSHNFGRRKFRPVLRCVCADTVPRRSYSRLLNFEGGAVMCRLTAAVFLGCVSLFLTPGIDAGELTRQPNSRGDVADRLNREQLSSPPAAHPEPMRSGAA